MSSEELFFLKWNDFPTHILSIFESMQETEDLADVTLTCEGKNIKAHKFILSACSPYFRSVFKDNPCSHPIVILKDVHFIDLYAILNFMYQGEVNVQIEQLPTFLKTAELLKVSGLNEAQEIKTNKRNTELKNDCNKRLKICANNEKIDDTFEIVCVDGAIKTEILDEENYDLNENITPDEVDGFNKGLLGAALTEVKDVHGRSILERSLTVLSEKECAITSIGEYIAPKKPPDEVENAHINTQHNVDGDLLSGVGDGEVNTSSTTQTQPHHSSQCGNCPHCGKIYSNQSSLKYHVRLIHSDLLNMYCCHVCPQTFNYREGYKKHMTDVHKIRT